MPMTPDKPRRLGRGLEALLATRSATADSTPDAARHDLRRIPIAEIHPNPFQPRTEFAPEALAELQASLKENGLLQPVTVRPARTGLGYELIAGERRLRAAAGLGWHDIPAAVRDIDDQTLLTLALVENLQRADLNPIEEARGYKRLQNEFSLTQQQVAQAVGKDRSTVANILRLLNLPDAVQQILLDGHLTLGHVRPLLAMSDASAMISLARETVAKGLSVREVEQRVRPDRAPAPKRPAAATPEHDKSNQEARRIADRLRKHLQTDVSLAVSSNNRGTIQIAFYSAEDLDRLLDIILGHQSDPR